MVVDNALFATRLLQYLQYTVGMVNIFIRLLIVINSFLYNL